MKVLLASCTIALLYACVDCEEAKPALTRTIQAMKSIEDILKTFSFSGDIKFQKDPCSLPQVKGNCRGYMNRWYYDKKSRKCTKFVYGGCGANENNFETEQECRINCASSRKNGIPFRFTEPGRARGDKETGHRVPVEELKRHPLARQAQCKPRRELVDTSTLTLRDGSGTSHTVIWPSVIAYKQCGGGCNDLTRQCGVTPDGYVIKTDSLMAISHKDNKITFVPYTYQEHKKCSCAGCKVKSHQCSGREKYEEDECRCACGPPQKCGKNQQWSPSSCDCVCSNHDDEDTCLGDFKMWSDALCECITLSHSLNGKK